MLSPLLANIYLARLDRFVDQELVPAYTAGEERKGNPAYTRLLKKASTARTQRRAEEAKRLRQQMQHLPSRDPNDPGFRRLKYVRYADDFLLGFIGPRSEAEDIKGKLEVFLRDHLKLELSQTKTLITHARSETARFLGYEVQTLHNDRKLTKGRRSVNARIGFRVPQDVVEEKCQEYSEQGEPIYRPELMKASVFSIISDYQAEYRGVVEYYRMAYNLNLAMGRLKWVMERSLTKTLAAKLRISVKHVYERYHATLIVQGKPYQGLQVTIEREEKNPLVAQWGGIPLIWDIKATLNDQPERIWNSRSELEERLLADTCEYCGVIERCEVHHVRALKDLQVQGRRPKPQWMVLMAARQRKTMVVCKTCHQDITYGRPMRRRETRGGFMHGEAVASQEPRA